MRAKLGVVVAAMMMWGTTFGAPANAQSHEHPTVPVAYLGACPQRGDNRASYVNYHGHHAINIFTDGSGWAGFVIAANTSALDHGHFPTVGAPPVPPGTYSFSLLQTSISDPIFFISFWTSSSGCFIRNADVVPNNHGVVKFTVPSGIGAVQVYAANTQPVRDIVGSILYEGHSLHWLTLKDQTENTLQDFCSFGNACE